MMLQTFQPFQIEQATKANYVKKKTNSLRAMQRLFATKNKTAPMHQSDPLSFTSFQFTYPLKPNAATAQLIMYNWFESILMTKNKNPKNGTKRPK